MSSATHFSGKGYQTILTTITVGIYIMASHKGTYCRFICLKLCTIPQQKSTIISNQV